jgi:hypothetical protein
LSGVRGEVLARRRRWLAARALEAALLGGGAAAAALAAQRLSGAAPPAHAAAGACLCAALAAAAFLRGRAVDERAFARGLDARVGAQGALATACEAERRGDPDPLAAHLGARTTEALARTRWRGAAAPPSPLAVAALLAGLAFVAAVGTPATPAPWSEVEERVGELEGRAAAGDVPEAELARALERLAEALDAAQPAPVLRREVERRRDAALARLEGRAEAAGDPGAGATGGADVPAGGGATGAAGSSGATLAADAGDRTMSRPAVGPTMRPPSSDAPAPSTGAAPAPAPTWPRRPDPRVAG